MKRIFLAFAIFLSAEAFAKDAASLFLDQTLTSAQNILAEKDESDRLNGMCALLKESMGNAAISRVWLSTYGQMDREAQAVARFPELVPAIMMTKAIPLLGGGGEGSIKVDEAAKSRGNNIYEVGVTVTVNGKDHRGAAVIEELAPGLFKINDAEYMGLSAVTYQGRDFQQFMKREFEKDPVNSMPVSALIQHITSQSDFINCP